jgi:hypothetical protein
MAGENAAFEPVTTEKTRVRRKRPFGNPADVQGPVFQPPPEEVPRSSTSDSESAFSPRTSGGLGSLTPEGGASAPPSTADPEHTPGSARSDAFDPHVFDPDKIKGPNLMPYPKPGPIDKVFAGLYDRTTGRQVTQENNRRMEEYNAKRSIYEHQLNADSYSRIYGPGSATKLVIGADGKLHNSRFNARTGQDELDPNVAYDPRAASATITGQSRLEAARVRYAHSNNPGAELIRIINDPETDDATLQWAQDRMNAMPQFGNFRPPNPRAEPRPPSSQQATITLKDGSKIPGSYDPATKRYYDGAGVPIPLEQLAGAQRPGTEKAPGKQKKSFAEFLGEDQGGANAPPAAGTSQRPTNLPHPPAATKTGLKPNNRYRINGKIVTTDAQGNLATPAAN